jgi:hypothetical protein
VFRRASCELPSKGRQWVVTWRITARVGAWAGRYLWRGVSRCGDANGKNGECLVLTVLSSTVLAVLLIIGGVEQNPGPAVEVENTVRLL